MKVGVPKETVAGERRVALVPEAAARLVQAGHEVLVEAGAGAGSYFPDPAYEAAGAQLSRGPVAAAADVLLKVQPPTTSEVGALRPGVVLISFLQPSGNAELIQALAAARVTALSLELIPRISRAQAMDALSSQAGVAGYRAVLIAADRLPKFFPMLMTAAGTVAPARVFVLGAGVAGLQAIATARRLGAVVEAFDVRPAVREEVRSLGARFVELELESQEGAGGYAGEQSEEFLAKQRELVGDHVAASDVVITTAAIPGRRAPLLVTAEMVRRMRPGSVIVDLAAESGGNCELSRPGEEVVESGVTIHGVRNLPSSMPAHASQLYSKNVTNLLALITREATLAFDLDDEIVRSACVTHGGEILHQATRDLIAHPAASG
ncbi:MAG: Re/Si-specific NAD(P)(+) transhydrogenase subunit alpha [Candidatus Dormibacteraceae bacterium]